MTAGRAIHQLQDETSRAHHESGQQRSNRALSIQPRPQNSQDEAGRNRRADVSLYTLQVDVKLAADQVDERNPCQSENYHDASHYSTKAYELPFGRVGLDFLVEV